MWNASKRKSLQFCSHEFHVKISKISQIQHKINSINVLSWTTCSNPIVWPNGWSHKLIATSLANEPWRDGKWMKLIDKKDSGGYDQFGVCKGQVKIYDDDSANYINDLLPKVEIIELNLPGIRQRRWGPNKNHHLHRTGVLIGSVKDGFVFEVGAFSAKFGLSQ